MRWQIMVSASLCLTCMIPGASLATQPKGAPPFSMADFDRAAGIEIDGQIEPAWLVAPVIDAFEEYRPRAGAPAKVRTEVRMGRDATHFYLVARLFDPDIARLRTGLARRDNFSNEQDWFSVALDAVGSSRGAQLFYFNARGVIWDGLLNEEAGTANPAADFEVEVATSIDRDSWVVELRIPFEELRYRSRSPDTWKVIFRRNYPREDRHAMAAPAIPSSPPCLMCLASPDAAARRAARPPRNQLRAAVVRPGDARKRRRGWRLELRAGTRHRREAARRPGAVFDATVNPDFSQLELDTPQLSSNQQFAAGLSGEATVLSRRHRHTRLATAGHLHPLDHRPGLGRARHAPRLLGWRPAHLARRRWRHRRHSRPLFGELRGAGFPLAGHARPRSQAGRQVTLGGLFTDRRADDDYNTVAGPDLAWRLSPTTRVSAQWLTSRTRDELETQGDAIGIDMLHDSRHWRAALTLRELDPGFRADNGYIPQVGIRQVDAELRYKFLGLRAISELAPYLNMDTREDFDHHTVSSAPRLGAQATLTNNMIVTGEWRPREQVRLHAGGELHSLSQGYLSVTSYPVAWLPVMTFELAAGEAMDFTTDRVGQGETVSASLLWRPLDRLVIEPRFDMTSVRTDADGFYQGQRARESAAQLLATVHLTTRDRFRLMLQRVAFERDAQGDPLLDTTRLSGSLLFTHEHSLVRRIYVGVAFARDSDRTIAQPRETLEVFLKVQSGMSAATGVRW